ncbi:4-diphosphocytidyl-2-C-methyl-D-erythritol kinase [Butyrivibrio hungatei DSM 14810]|uniref:4-diphosphocytidyl-2-C-methyl-D-erythritol kinase n=1 Tax=Butyrivibrio hungatei DSM 14810 TaxID=1121132 RepID=A0A1M7STR8_9FIRM|nr:4-(cytidine 5'-diphospho)-2-C-methyl-D-erythritol kinase [Butyrivibrio hungatei]SHN61841.1 4-diphosphocytidyl-2-C-methyl-D-erythritol kinase [Butyrivibrio hungatei DSM 14810]
MKQSRKAYGKINLGLDVTGKRADGYHIVRMIMQNVDIYDTLTFEENETGEIVLTASSESIPTDDSNLICKVAKQLKEKFNVDKGINIHLEKRIPVAAGMAGGSTDGAAAYLALNDIWGLGQSKEELCKLAVSLGADIPYCIMGGTMVAEGIGEELTAIADMPECLIVVAKPAIGVSTGWVYTELDSKPIEKHPDIDGIRSAIENGDLKGMCALIDNVLEHVTASKYEEISKIEKVLEDNGAIRAFMTGSGPTVFGIFDDENKAREAYKAVEESGLAPELFLTKPINPNR